MSRYDGLIIPRSYSEYINKTDAATLSQALALPGVMDAAPTENSNKAARSGGIYNAIDAIKPVDTVTLNNMHSVTSNAVAKAINYSTSEVNTGKKWIDGKPIYRKTFIFTNLTLTNSPTLIGTIDVAISNVIKTEEIVRQSDVLAGSSQQAVYAEQNGNVYAYQNVSSTHTGWEVYYTLEYTKTTD